MKKLRQARTSSSQSILFRMQLPSDFRGYSSSRLRSSTGVKLLGSSDRLGCGDGAQKRSTLGVRIAHAKSRVTLIKLPQAPELSTELKQSKGETSKRVIKSVLSSKARQTSSTMSSTLMMWKLESHRQCETKDGPGNNKEALESCGEDHVQKKDPSFGKRAWKKEPRNSGGFTTRRVGRSQNSHYRSVFSAFIFSCMIDCHGTLKLQIRISTTTI